jgi:hypothetical protein
MTARDEILAALPAVCARQVMNTIRLVSPGVEFNAAGVDSMHAQVVTRRFQDQAGWRTESYAADRPTQVAALPWDAIVEIRRDPNIARFGAMSREVEDEVAERAPAEGLRRAIDRVYMRELGQSAGRMEGMTAPVVRALQIVVFGLGGGLVTQGPRRSAKHCCRSCHGRRRRRRVCGRHSSSRCLAWPWSFAVDSAASVAPAAPSHN